LSRGPEVPIAESGLDLDVDLDVDVVFRCDDATGALVRHLISPLISHLHRAAHQARVLAR